MYLEVKRRHSRGRRLSVYMQIYKHAFKPHKRQLYRIFHTNWYTVVCFFSPLTNASLKQQPIVCSEHFRLISYRILAVIYAQRLFNEYRPVGLNSSAVKFCKVRLKRWTREQHWQLTWSYRGANVEWSGAEQSRVEYSPWGTCVHVTIPPLSINRQGSCDLTDQLAPSPTKRSSAILHQMTSHWEAMGTKRPRF